MRLRESLHAVARMIEAALSVLQRFGFWPGCSFRATESVALNVSLEVSKLRSLEESVERNLSLVQVLGESKSAVEAAYPVQNVKVLVEAFQLDEAEVFTHGGFITSPQRKLLQSFYAGRPNSGRDDLHLLASERLKRRVFRTPTVLKGTSFSLLTPGSEGYYHFLIESLPRIFVAQAMDIDLGLVDHVLVPGNFRKHAEWTFSRLGLNSLQSRIVEVHKRNSFHCEHLISTGSPTFGGWLSSPAVKGFASMRSAPHDGGPPKRIYVTRSNRRRVTNEGDLEGLLREYGIVPVDLESIDFASQISLFSNAEVVVGPHGAGLSNLVFSKDCKVFELMPARYVNFSFAVISEVVELQHHIIMEPRDSIVKPGDARFAHGDFRVDVNLVQAALECSGVDPKLSS